VLNKAKICGETDWSGIDNPEGAELVRYLLKYPETLLLAAEKYEPSYIGRHIMNICKLFNKFYYEYRIIDLNEPAITNCRLKLTLAVKTVIANALEILGLNAPEQM
jgi:arginyl-tRNA synthetase